MSTLPKILITLFVILLLALIGIFLISKIWKAPTNIDIMLDPTITGIILAIFSIILAIIFFLKTANLDNQLKSINYQINILKGLHEAQSDRDKKFSKTLKGIEKQIILESTIEWVRIQVYFKGVDNYEQSQFYFWLFKTNVLDIKMFLDLPGKFNTENFPVQAKNVHPEDYILFDRWVAEKTDSNKKKEYHQLSTHGFKKDKFIIGELYVEPSSQLRNLRIKDFHKSYLKILANDKAKNNVDRIEVIFNDSIFFKVFPEKSTIKEVIKVDEYPDKLNPKNVYTQKWFLIGIVAPHTIGTGPFEITLY